MPIVLSPNMNLPVPVVGQEAGPQYATDINSCMAILDSHTHSPGAGVQITPNGININTNLPFNDNNLTGVRTVNFNANGSSLPGMAPDLGCIYVAGVDLFYNDESGNVIQITQSGGVAGSNGSISNLTPPASASYVSGTQTFVWQSAANTAANMDNGSITIREVAANANGVTIESPTALAADYTVTLFNALPGSNQPVSINSSGQLSAGQIVTSQITDLNVTTAKLADQSVTQAKLTAQNFIINDAADGSQHSNSTTSYVQIAPDVVITTSTGTPIEVGLRSSYVAANQSFILADTGDFKLQILRDGVEIVIFIGGITNVYTSPASYSFIDTGATAGTHTYSFNIATFSLSGDVVWINVGSYAYETR